MSFWKTIGVSVIVFLLGAGIVNLLREKRELEKEGGELEANLSELQKGNKKLQEEVRYFENEENLLKEAKSQFNYRAPEEKLFIIVPETTSTRE